MILLLFLFLIRYSYLPISFLYSIQHAFAFKYQEEDVFEKLANFHHQATASAKDTLSTSNGNINNNESFLTHSGSNFNLNNNGTQPQPTEDGCDEFSMTQEDWDILLKDAESVSFKKGRIHLPYIQYQFLDLKSNQ